MPLLLSSVLEMCFLFMLKSWLVSKWVSEELSILHIIKANGKGNLTVMQDATVLFSRHAMEFLCLCFLSSFSYLWKGSSSQTSRMQTVRVTELKNFAVLSILEDLEICKFARLPTWLRSFFQSLTQWHILLWQLHRLDDGSSHTDSHRCGYFSYKLRSTLC